MYHVNSHDIVSAGSNNIETQGLDESAYGQGADKREDIASNHNYELLLDAQEAINVERKGNSRQGTPSRAQKSSGNVVQAAGLGKADP